MEFLSKNDLRSLVPSVFSKAPSAGLSEKYVHIPTEDVLKLNKLKFVRAVKTLVNTLSHSKIQIFKLLVMMVIQFFLKYYLLTHMMVNHHSNSELDYLD